MPAPGLSPRRARNRNSLLAQVPQRVGDLRRRGERMQRDGWDVNAMLLLANDAEALADTTSRLGDPGTSERLVALAESLWTYLDAATIPHADDAAALVGALQALTTAARTAPSPLDEVGEEATLFGYSANDDNGFPLLVRPPPRYWRRFAEDAAAPPAPATPAHASVAQHAPPAAAATAVGARAATKPVPTVPRHTMPSDVAAAPIGTEPPVASAPASPLAHADESQARLAYHLGEAGTRSDELDLKLRAQGYDIVRAAGVDALKELLSRVPPALVVLADIHEDAIEEIGALVQAARARTSRRVVWVTLSDQTDLGTRLRVMRAGSDALIAQPATATDVVARIREFTDAENADPYRVMIVEDDRSQALFAESILRKTGMQTLAVGEASSVLDKLDAFQPDLILMDLHMPDCDGMELTALIREREAFISTPIVFLSGESDTERHFEALDAGGDDFLSKPIAPKHLIAAVSSRVRRARQLERRRLPTLREPVKGVHDIVALTRRLTEMLTMEDAASRSGGLLFIEIEDGQRLHGRLGQRAHEALLANLGAILAGHIGAADMLARCGDAGFLLLNPDRDGAALAALATNLRERVARETFRAGEAPLRLGVVIGICPFAATAGDAKAMIDAAERAMLEARSPDRGGICTFQPRTDGAASPLVAKAIAHALATSGFRVVFQPIVSLHGEEDEQFQALLRLPTEDGRMYAASELVPAAEQAGLIADVDRWMLDNCIRTIGERLRDGHGLRLFVSQSLGSVRDAERTDWLRRTLDQHRVPASHISLELRMDDAIEALAEVVAFALAMKQIGVGMTISGFEAGARGNELLRHLPVDFVKLSARYARAHDDAVRVELRELVRLAHESGRRVIAPRVEEARVAASLWSSGVDLIQGNFVQQAGDDMSYDFHAASA